MERSISSQTASSPVPSGVISIVLHVCAGLALFLTSPFPNVADGAMTVQLELVSSVSQPLPVPQPPPDMPLPSQEVKTPPPVPSATAAPKPVPVKHVARFRPSVAAAPVAALDSATSPSLSAVRFDPEPESASDDSHQPLPHPPVLSPSAAAGPSPALYEQSLWQHIMLNRPRDSVGTGQVVVGFTLDRHGELLSLRLVDSSGHPRFDRAILMAVRLASPFPPPPDSLSNDKLSFQISFQAQASSL